MKIQLRRWAMMAVAATGLSACSAQKTSTSIFEKTSSEECTSAASETRFIVRYTDGSVEAVEAPSKQEFLDGFVRENLQRIEFAEHDFKVKAGARDLASVSASALANINNWGQDRIEADALWDQGVTGNGVVVAIVDSGMDLTHPQLAPQIFGNPGEQGVDANGHDRATNGIDDDGNGFVDDAVGYDFFANRPLKGDYNYHGSHVAGIIAAAHSDTTAGTRSYVQGVAPRAKILPLAFLNADGDGMMSNGVTAIKYAADRGARVINASWGGSMCSRALREVVASLEARGIVFVAAAGNDSINVDLYKEYPASLNLGSQITVGATGEQNNRAEYSNFGPLAVHIFAPGTNIISTVPGGFGTLSGTSMATPMVSGAVALLLGAEPQATPSQIRQALSAAAAKRSDYENASKGRLNLANALGELRRILTQ